MQPIPGIAYLSLVANVWNLFFRSWLEGRAVEDFMGGSILMLALVCVALWLLILLGAMLYVITLFYRKRPSVNAVHALVVTLITFALVGIHYCIRERRLFDRWPHLRVIDGR